MDGLIYHLWCFSGIAHKHICNIVAELTYEQFSVDLQSVIFTYPEGWGRAHMGFPERIGAILT